MNTSKGKVNKKESFSTRLKDWRARHQLRQEDAALLLGIGRTYYSQLENNREPGEHLEKKFGHLEQETGEHLQATLVNKLRASIQPLREESLAGIILRDTPADYSPRSMLRQWRERAGFATPADLAKAIGYKIGVLQNLENGSGRISEKMADAIAKALNLSDEERSFLTAAGESAPTTGVFTATVGTRPDVQTPPGITARMIPIISWAQAGSLHALAVEDLYEYEGTLAFNVKDPGAIAIPIKGDSMEPQFSPGDIAVVYPNHQPRTGNLVIAKLKDGTVLFKRFTVVGPGEFKFTSYNSDLYPAFTKREEEIEWIHPVAKVEKDLL